ncbi:uncharacterized protein LOC119098400 [Pollicipes pollicipes]|uniref:uncharacterized protein LOC119098400 n=1 Tax=Pollicipes pollicipes TaxID=41117 RepID=UPI0018855AC2|nr:uncharacterized protein LOC119098400 [Pollicipes pollicipes]
MKLLAVLCACALVAADHHGGEDHAPSSAQLGTGLNYLFRPPDQIKLQDALDVRWRQDMYSSNPVESSRKAIFDGAEKNTFSHIYSIISPEAKGFDGTGQWIRHNALDVLIGWHHGAAFKIHMLTDGGIHKEVVLGNPLDREGAKFVAIAPKSTLWTIESASDETFALFSLVAVPGWTEEGFEEFSLKDMGTKFPDHSELFKALATPGISKSGDHDQDDDGHRHHDHDDDHHGYHHHGRYGYRSHHRR